MQAFCSGSVGVNACRRIGNAVSMCRGGHVQGLREPSGGHNGVGCDGLVC